MENHNHKIPFEFEEELGHLKIDVDYEIKPAYYGTKVDDIKDFNDAELKDFSINEAIFINDEGLERELTNEEIREIEEDVRDYFVENLDDFMD